MTHKVAKEEATASQRPQDGCNGITAVVDANEKPAGKDCLMFTWGGRRRAGQRNRGRGRERAGRLGDGESGGRAGRRRDRDN